MRRSAFTLMELLIVISIIIILMGLLFPVISMVKNHTKKVKTVTVINQLDAACSQYKSICGVYPDSDAIAGILLPGGANSQVAVTALKDADWVNVGMSLMAVLQVVDRDNFNSIRYPSGYITDAWNNVIRYRPVRYYPYAQNPGTVNTHPIAIDGQSPPPPHQDSYQAWSKGLDEIDQYGDPSSDDITNWQ